MNVFSIRSPNVYGGGDFNWDRIVPGKIDRFISDNTTLDQEMCLLDQDFIKDEQQSVAEHINTYGDAEVSSFKRVSLG